MSDTIRFANGTKREIKECADCGERGVICATPDGEITMGDLSTYSVSAELAEAALLILAASEFTPNTAVCEDCEGERSAARKRGRGRPPLNPKKRGKTLAWPIRLSDANLDEIGLLIAEGRGKNVSDVVRALLDESASRRKR